MSLTIETKGIRIKACNEESSNSEKRSGKFVDSKVLFDSHITDLFRETRQKIHALFKVASYIIFEKNDDV